LVCRSDCRASGVRRDCLRRKLGRHRALWPQQAGLAKTFLELPNGIPSHDTFRRVFMLIDPDAFEAGVNADPCAVADRLWVKNHLDPEEEKLWFSN
jgi:hypothetical protein